MYQDICIEISLSNELNLLCSKGEIVYFKHSEKSQKLFDQLINPQGFSGKTFKVRGLDLNLILEDLQAYRRKLSYLAEDEPKLISGLNLHENIKLYSSSIKALNFRDQTTQLSSFKLNKTDFPVNLGPQERFYVQWLICMLKAPQILLIENPYLQIDPEAYKTFMFNLHQRMQRTTMTTLISLQNLSLIEEFRGRLVQL